MRLSLSVLRLRSFAGLPGRCFPWLLPLAVFFAGLGSLFHFAAKESAPDIQAALHRRAGPVQGEPIELGRTVALERGEKYFYSLRLRPDCHHLLLEADGQFVRILLNSREIGAGDAKIDNLGSGKSRAHIDLSGDLGEEPRLDVWLVATDGVSALRVANRVGDIFSGLFLVCCVGGGLALVAAAVIMCWRCKDAAQRAFCTLAESLTGWRASCRGCRALALAGLAVAVAGVWVFYQAQILPYDVTAQVGKADARPVRLPHNGSSAQGETCIYRGLFDYGLLTSSKIKLVPDDRLVGFTINGNVVDLSSVEQWKLGDWGGGFELDIEGYLLRGKNTFEVQVLNLSDPFGLSLRTAPASMGYVLGLLIVGAGLSVLLLGVCQSLGLKNSIIALLAISTLLRVLYLGYTGPYERSYDVGGHLEHMDYILREHRRPSSTECWECHQPSSYYLLSAAAYTLGKRLPIPEPVSVLVGLSLAFDLIFLLFSARFFQELSERWSVKCCVLLFFWPSGILNSIRINNDAPMYAFAAATLFFGLRWMRTKAPKDICLSALFAALVTITKISGLFVLPVVFCMWLGHARAGAFREGWFWRQTAAAAAIIMLGFGILYADKFHSRWGMTESERITPIVHTIDSSLRVENKFRNYWLFDLRDFLEEPYTHSRDDRGGRQFLLNFFLKSSLFGEFHYYQPYAQVYLAHVLKAWLLVLLIVFSIGLLRIGHLWPGIPLVLAAAVLFPFASLVYFRMNLPFSCNQDFRYVYPIMLGFIPLCVSGLEQAESVFGRPFRTVRRCFFPLWPPLVITFFLMPYFST